MIRSTGRYVLVSKDGDERRHVRLLHLDTNKRECVRYEKRWWLVRRVGSVYGNPTYVLDKTM